jgi:hypothetical protein
MKRREARFFIPVIREATPMSKFTWAAFAFMEEVRHVVDAQLLFEHTM